jgi:hypothetical protein
VQFGQHGETPHLPWDYAIVEDTAAAVAVRFIVRTQKTPFLLEKTLRLRSGVAALEIEETVTNESGVPLHAMWGHYRHRCAVARHSFSLLGEGSSPHCHERKVSTYLV